MNRRRATAIAHPNVALVKYWGKRDVPLNLPAAGSVSVTLAGIQTRTTVEFSPNQDRDLVILNGRSLWGPRLNRTIHFLDRLRDMASVGMRAMVTTENDFPTAAGLASSSSGFAALALAASAALGLELSLPELSVLARLGSGSAARSVYGGFVEMLPGRTPHGNDAYAVQLASEEHWDLRCLAVLTASGEKSVGSTEAMNRTRDTSPYYEPWVHSVPEDILQARQAIRTRDLMRLAQIAERSCLRMHASALAAEPGLLFWNGMTVDLIHHVRKLRAGGLPVFFTIDAGPHVKVFCESADYSAVIRALRVVVGDQEILSLRAGPGAYLVDESRA